MDQFLMIVDKNMALSNIESVESLSIRAGEMLRRFNLDDAEDLYIKLIYNLRANPAYRKELAICYAGLAEVYMNHGNAFRADCEEWQWGSMQCLVLLRKAISVCSQTLSSDKEVTTDVVDNINQVSLNNTKTKLSKSNRLWFIKERSSLVKRLKLIENALVLSLYKVCQQRSRLTTKEMISLARGTMKKEDMEASHCSANLEKLRYSYEQELVNMQDLLLTAIRNKKKLNSRKYKVDDLQKEESVCSPLRRAASMDCLERNTVINYRAVKWRRGSEIKVDNYSDNDEDYSGPQRPKSLFIKSLVKHLSVDEKVQRAVSLLKEKAESVKSKSFFPRLSTISSWRNLKKQHESILDQTLDEFDSETENFISNSENYISDFQNSVTRSYTMQTNQENGISNDENSSCDSSSPDDVQSFNGYDNKNFVNENFMNQNSIYKSEAHYTREVSIGRKTDNLLRTGVTNNDGRGIDVQRILNLGNDIQDNQRNQFDRDEFKVGSYSYSETRRYDHTPDTPLRLHHYSHTPSPNEFSDYQLDSFCEMSPVTEISCLDFDKLYNYNDAKMNPSILDAMPISLREVNLTLAYCFYRLANQEFEKKSYPKATALYEQALAVFLEVYKLGILDDCMAQALANSGKIKVVSGDITGGVSLMEQALRLLETYHKTMNHIDISNIWFEIGNAYISKHTQGDNLREHLTRQVRKELYNEIVNTKGMHDDESDDESTDGEEDQTPSGGGSGDSYSINAYEALRCYQHAHSILTYLADSNNQTHVQELVKVLVKLGDCSVLNDDYDKAIQYYEDALKMFPCSYNSGLLVDNAHVLTMLGIVRFLLHNYSKAATLLECAHVMSQHVHTTACSKVEMSFALSVMSLTHYAGKNYYKSTSWALRAINIYNDLYEEAIPELPRDIYWLVNFTVYSLAYSYLSLGDFNRALNFLLRCNSYCTIAKHPDHILEVLVLKACAQCYDGLEDHSQALQYYKLATQKNEENKKRKLHSLVLHEELLGSSAQMHMTLKQWGKAAEAYEIVRDLQDSMEDDIKGDMVSLLHQLGQTNATTCNVNKSIECYLECLETYKEMHGTVGPEMAATFANLATMCHVKACMSELSEDVNEMTSLAEYCFKQAIELEFSSNIALKFANFLFHQLNFADCALNLLRAIEESETDGYDFIVFSFIEQVLAPGLLELEVEDEEITVDSNLFIQYLLILTYKELHLFDDAEKCIFQLMDVAYSTLRPQPFAVLGYALMELDLYEEASRAFQKASGFWDGDFTLRSFCRNFCVAMCFYEAVISFCQISINYALKLH